MSNVLTILVALAPIVLSQALKECPSFYDPNPSHLESDENGNINLPECYCDVYDENVHKLDMQLIKEIQSGNKASKNLSPANYTLNTMLVQCLYGTPLENIIKALKVVSDQQPDIPIGQVRFTAINIGSEEGIPSGTFADFNWAPEVSFSVSCYYGTPFFTLNSTLGSTLEGLEDRIVTFSLDECKMDSIHEDINKLTNLRHLKIRTGMLEITNDRFSNLSELEELDLTDNNMKNIELGTFANMTKLKLLSLSKNLVNESIWPVINEVPSLIGVDLTQCDRIEDMPPNAIDQLNNLEQLIMLKSFIKALYKDTLFGLGQLRHLDVQINNIDLIEPGAFEHTPNLETLLITGNYINLQKDMLKGLTKLKNLEAGVNEYNIIQSDLFDNTPNLEKVVISSDSQWPPLIDTIETGAFDKLANLQQLQITNGNLTELEPGVFDHLTKLKVLNLVGNKLSSLPDGIFTNLDNLEELSLAANNFTMFNTRVFQPIEDTLEALDISYNPYICDDQLAPLIRWIGKKYEYAQAKGIEFELVDSLDTICEKPNKLYEKALTNLDPKTLVPYDPSTETTTSTTTTTTTTTTVLASVDADGNIITEGTTTLPEFDIDTSTRTTPKRLSTTEISLRVIDNDSAGLSTNLIIIIVIVAALLIIITLLIVFLTVRKRQRDLVQALKNKEAKIEMEEVNGKPNAPDRKIDDKDMVDVLLEDNVENIGPPKPTHPHTNGVVSKSPHDEITVYNVE